jgi:hypothetical protein
VRTAVSEVGASGVGADPERRDTAALHRQTRWRFASSQNLSSGFGRKSSRAGRLLLGSLGGGPIQGAGKGPINIPGVGPRMYAKHPGTKGKHFVELGKKMARPVASKAYAQKQITEPLRQVFGG